MPPPTPRLERNVRLYPWYAASVNALFWLPVFFLFFSRHLTLAEVLRLEALYYAAVVVVEVPSGWFSDRIGRLPTLLVSGLALAASHGLFLVAEDLAIFAAAQVLLAVGLAFNSGTDTSFHYDSLVALGREDRFGEREAVAARAGFVAGAAAAVVGGLAGAIDLRAAYGLSLVAALVGVGIVLLMVEPLSDDERSHAGLLPQLRDCVSRLGDGCLRWLFAFAVLMTVLNHVPYEFAQPWLEEAVRLEGLDERVVPIVTGTVTGVTMLVAALVAGRSIRIRERLGTGATLLAAAAGQSALITIMALVVHPTAALLVILRSAPRGLMTAPLNAAIAPRVGSTLRATYLSLQSLVGRLAFSATLVGLSFLAGTPGAGWSSIERMLGAAAFLGWIGFILLLLTSGTLSRRST